MAQTADGYLWIGTSKGLVRYDGLTFKLIREGDSNTEAKFSVLGLLIDSNDQLWATDEHTRLLRYVAGHLVGPALDNRGDQYPTGLLAKTREGWLIVVSESRGIVAYERGSAHVLLDRSRMPRAPTAVVQTADGAFWIGTREAGLFHLTIAQGRTEIQHLTALRNTKVNCLLPIGNSALLIGTDKGVLSVHNGNLTESRPGLAGVEILALANGRDGTVWIGTDGRVFKAHGGDIDREGRIRALEDLDVRGTVTALFEDRDGNLWIGGPDVIERYRDSGFTTYLSSAGLPCNNCGAIYIDRQDRIWFAPWDGGLFLLSQDSIRAIETAGLKDDSVYSIAGGADDEVWVARKYGGLTRLHLQGNGIQATTYTQGKGLAQDSVYSIYRAQDGTVWAGTLGGGLSRFRDGSWRTFSTRDGLPSNTISAITGNTAGEMFVGTSNGLAVLTGNHWTAYTAEQGLPPGAVESLLLDGAGTLWIGTSKGISFLQSGAVRVPLGAPNALYGEILGIAESNGWLWITTRDHVLRVRRAALLNQSFGEGDYREFGVMEGLPSTEGVKRSRSVVVDDRGRIWFSLNKGISVLEPSAFVRPAFPVMIRLDGMLVDGRAVPSDNFVHIPAGQHRLTFRYNGVNVSNPDAVRYRYRLDNVDPAWSEPTALREIDYTNTPPGQFQFHVMARNPDGLWSTQETIMAFEIEPAYWQTRWFALSAFSFLALVALALVRLRVHALTRQLNVRFEERLSERTRIAQELHDTLLQGLLSASMQLSVANDQLDAVSPAKTLVNRVLQLMNRVVDEGRNAVRGLRSSSRTFENLEQAFSTIPQELAIEEPVGLRVIADGTPRRLRPSIRDEIYLVGREGVVNAIRHSGAKEIKIEIEYGLNRFRVNVSDDGSGIDPQVLEEGRDGHWGLSGMRERAERIGAKLRLLSRVSSGTEIELLVPGSVVYEPDSSTRSFRFFDLFRFRFPWLNKSTKVRSQEQK